MMPERNCAKCTRQIEWGCEAVSYEVVNEKGIRETRWHKGSNSLVQLNGEDIQACPRQDIRQRPYVWHRMLLFYGMYKQGHFPDAGSVVDQSNFAIEIFRTFDQIGQECDAALDEDRQNKAAQDARLRAAMGA